MRALLVPLIFVGTAATAAEPPLCTDRPAKANAVCTVPAGSIQVETAGADWFRLEGQGVRTDTLFVGSSLVKYGLSDRSDIELGVSPFVHLSTTNGSTRERLSGVGDTQLRYKQRLTSPDAKVRVAVIPFVKLPTARRGIGNRAVEGGLALPVSAPAGAWTVTIGPEVDVLLDADGAGRHPALVNVFNLTRGVTPRLSLTAELWSKINLDPLGTVRQASADAAIAYALSDRLQIDVGANAGLTRATPDVEFYAGLSTRF